MPRGKDPAGLTVAEAVQLLTERIAKLAESPPRGKARGPAKARKAKPADAGGEAAAKQPKPKSKRRSKAASEE